MRTLVFIPAFNEADSVGVVINDLQQQLPNVDILVIDDGSTDSTAAAARHAGARVASLPFNQGLGCALQTGYLIAEREGYDFCAHLDADGQHPVIELKRLLEEVWSGECDLALGSRWHTPSYAELEGSYKPTFARSVGIKLFRALLTFTTKHNFTDTTSGFRAANRKIIRLFAHRYQPDFAELESLQRAVRHDLRVKEVGVQMLPRIAGESKITPLKSAMFTFKGLFVVSIGAMRSIEHVPDRWQKRGETPSTAFSVLNAEATAVETFDGKVNNSPSDKLENISTNEETS